MGDKKRKDPPGGSEMPQKKSRKRAADYLSDEEVDKTAAATTRVNGDVATSKKAVEHKKMKSQKSKKSNGETVTADGFNGVVEHAGTENVEATPSSMQAEAQNTVDLEMKDEFDPDRDEDGPKNDDLGAALLAGFDSDTSDHAEDKGLDVNNLGSIPNYKKTKKKLNKIEKKGDADTPGAIYVGRIPHGFYEPQMREYFSQFGEISRLRLSRNKRTGASKHFAFMEFKSEEVAKIVAETMDNYLMFGHILKCKFAPPETLHPDVWKGANKKYRKIPHEKLEKAKLEAPKSADQWRQKNEKEEKKREKKAKQLKEKMGYDSPVVKLIDPSKAVEANKIEAAKPKEVEDAMTVETSAVAAIEPPPVTYAEEIAVTNTGKKASMKEKKSSKEAKLDVEKPAREEKPAKKAEKANKKGQLDVEEIAKDEPRKKKDKSKKEKRAGIEKATEGEQINRPLTDIAEAENEAVEMSAQVLDGAAATGEEDWEDDTGNPSVSPGSDSDADIEDQPAPTQANSAVPQELNSKAPAAGELPVFKNPKIPRDATGKQIHRDAKGKYIPPLQRKQLARAKFAKDNPEAHKAMKNAKVSALKQKRIEKKEKRNQRMIEKFGPNNVRGGANYKSSKKDKKDREVKTGGRNE